MPFQLSRHCYNLLLDCFLYDSRSLLLAVLCPLWPYMGPWGPPLARYPSQPIATLQQVMSPDSTYSAVPLWGRFPCSIVSALYTFSPRIRLYRLTHYLRIRYLAEASQNLVETSWRNSAPSQALLRVFRSGYRGDKFSGLRRLLKPYTVL